MEKQLSRASAGESRDIRQPIESSSSVSTTMFQPVQPDQSEVTQIETLEKV